MAILETDLDLLAAMKKMKFKKVRGGMSAQDKLQAIAQFLEDYENTAQDTVEFAPEFVVVVRNILVGREPVKLVYLTDFEGEEK